jgi:hypothetical protein
MQALGWCRNRRSKPFSPEKKGTKLPDLEVRAVPPQSGSRQGEVAKVFCFFFSKKKNFLSIDNPHRLD